MAKKRYYRPRLTEADKKAICEYYTRGFSTSMISKALGWGESTIDRVRRESGVPAHRSEGYVAYRDQKLGEIENTPSLENNFADYVAEKAKEANAASKESEEEICKRAKNLNGEGSFHWIEDRKRWSYRKTVAGFGRAAFYGRTKEECIEKANDFCRSKNLAKFDEEGASFLDVAIAHAEYVVECLKNYRDNEAKKNDASAELVDSLWEAFDKYTSKLTEKEKTE